MRSRSFSVTFRVVAMAGLGAAFAGCGKGSTAERYPDASLVFDAMPDNRADTAPRPAPAVGDGNRLLVPGRAQLIGVGTDSCSSLTSPSGDIWCAFTLPSTFLGLTDLWVINLTEALTGRDILCNGGDANCLRLTSTLGSSSALQPFSSHGFFGDTLIYYANDNNGGNPAYVWRPGWPVAKLLAAQAELRCTGDAKGATAYCLGNVDTSNSTQVTADIFAGTIGTGSVTLPKIGTAIIAAGTEPNITKFQIALSPAGDWVAWSARPTVAGVETLNAQKIGDPTTQQVIAADVSNWAFSRDGQKWYWLKSFGASSTAPGGTLEMANFPPAAGGAPVAAATLMASVVSFREAGDKGLIVLHNISSNGDGDLSAIPDRGAPMTVTPIDSNVLGIVDVSRDGKALYAKNAQVDPLFGTNNVFVDLHVGGAALPAPCTLASTALTPPDATFSASGDQAAWIQFDSHGFATGSLTGVAACGSQVFSPDLWAWTFVGNEGMVFTESAAMNQSSRVDVTLKYGAFMGGALPQTGMTTTEIQQRAGLTYASLLPAYPAVLFTVYVGAGVDGLYVKALPFTATRPLPSGDAGVPASDGGTSADGGAADAGNG